MTDWFRRRQGLFSKDLGWGYMPINKEGWLVVLGFILVIVFDAFYLLKEPVTNDKVAIYVIVIFVMIIAVALIADYKCDEPYIFKRKKGENNDRKT